MSGIVGSRFIHKGSGLVGRLGTDGQVFTSAGAGKSHVFEEAAGVSKYKERRRETQTRIQSTRDNLERLLDMRQELKVKKDFHVSPFMDLNMTYFWKIKPPAKRTLVHIESRRSERIFDATLALTKQSISKTNIRRTVFKIPAMTVKVVVGIYYQALKLFLKKVPFVAHPCSTP